MSDLRDWELRGIDAHRQILSSHTQVHHVVSNQWEVLRERGGKMASCKNLLALADGPWGGI